MPNVTPKQAYDGDYWRLRAAGTRLKMAEAPEDGRRHLGRVAEEYEKLARRAENVAKSYSELFT